MKKNNTSSYMTQKAVELLDRILATYDAKPKKASIVELALRQFAEAKHILVNDIEPSEKEIV